MERLLAGLVPGLPSGPSRASWPGRTACPSTQSRPSGCCSPRAASCSRAGRAGRWRPGRGRGPRDPHRARRRAPRRPRPRRSGPGRRRGGPGPELHLAGLAAVSGAAETDLDRGCGASSGGSCSSRRRPRLPGGASTLSSRPWSARWRTTPCSARIARSTTSPPRASSRASGPTSSPAGSRGTYLAAQRLAVNPAEADALAAQARVRPPGCGRAGRRPGLARAGAHLPGPGPRDHDGPRRPGESSTRARSSRPRSRAWSGRRPCATPRPQCSSGGGSGIARRSLPAIAEQARVLKVRALGPCGGALAVLTEAWAEYSDLEATVAGVELIERVRVLLPGAQRQRGGHRLAGPDAADRRAARAPGGHDARDLGRGTSLLMGSRPREGIILLRGAHQLAIANDLHDES